jgi:hypothetical protein
MHTTTRANRRGPSERPDRVLADIGLEGWQRRQPTAVRGLRSGGTRLELEEIRDREANVLAAGDRNAVTFAEARPPSASLRHALAAVASDAEMRRRPKQALAHVRPIVDVVLRDPSAAGPEARTRLSDGAVIGLLHFARVVVDADHATSMVAPVACVAVGSYGQRTPRLDRPGSLLIVLDDESGMRRRGERIADFIAEGLTGLGVDVAAAARTVGQTMTLAEALPPFLDMIEHRRFVSGRCSLYADLSKAVSQRSVMPRSMAPAA